MNEGRIKPNKKNRESREFEILVARIEKSLCPQGAIVNSPEIVKGREIDATIRYTLGSIPITVAIECRKRKDVQDVTWVEQLYGKISGLGFTVMMGVSSTGFSAKAKEYGKKHKIELRKIDKITDKDILALSSLSPKYKLFTVTQGYKTQDVSFEFHDEDDSHPIDHYLQSLESVNGKYAIIHRRIAHLVNNERTEILTPLEIFDKYYHKELALGKMDNINVPTDGQSTLTAMIISFDHGDLYFLDKAKRTHVKSMTVRFVLYDKRDQLKMSGKTEYSNVANDEKLVETHEFESEDPSAIYKKVEYQFNVKTDQYILTGKHLNNEIMEFTQVALNQEESKRYNA